jgi:hypothetical protein
MARKTRQKKIIADLKRKLQAQEGKSASVVPQIVKESRLEFKNQKPSRSQVDTFSIPTDLIKKDLVRIIVLTIVAISLEFVVYLVWR